MSSQPREKAPDKPSPGQEVEGREQARKHEEQGHLAPDGKRRQSAQSQDATLKRPRRRGAPDGEKVPSDRESGPPDPAARGRDAPVDLR